MGETDFNTRNRLSCFHPQRGSRYAELVCSPGIAFAVVTITSLSVSPASQVARPALVVAAAAAPAVVVVIVVVEQVKVAGSKGVQAIYSTQAGICMCTVFVCRCNPACMSLFLQQKHDIDWHVRMDSGT